MRRISSPVEYQIEKPGDAGFFLCLIKSEKGREVSALFIPNLTINLTYLCYGSTKILGLRIITKKILQNP